MCLLVLSYYNTKVSAQQKIATHKSLRTHTPRQEVPRRTLAGIRPNSVHAHLVHPAHLRARPTAVLAPARTFVPIPRSAEYRHPVREAPAGVYLTGTADPTYNHAQSLLVNTFLTKNRSFLQSTEGITSFNK